MKGRCKWKELFFILVILSSVWRYFNYSVSLTLTIPKDPETLLISPQQVSTRQSSYSSTSSSSASSLQLDTNNTRNNTHRTTATKPTRPYFILHVGPPKTATTTIQCGLNFYNELLAKEDNYYYLGQHCATSREKNRTMANGENPILPREFFPPLISRTTIVRIFRKYGNIS